jgi:hypothetical protein
MANQYEQVPRRELTNKEKAAIKEVAQKVSPNGNNARVFEVLNRIPNSGVELMFTLKDMYGEGDPTPLILGGVLLDEAARRRQEDIRTPLSSVPYEPDYTHYGEEPIFPDYSADS